MELNQIYRCPVCGNIVELTHIGGGTLVCCGQPMQLLEEKSSEEGVEKHLPVVKLEGNTLKVNVGSIDHPMLKEHYIEWIECLVNNDIQRVYLSPVDKPYVEFSVTAKSDITVKAYCNIHGVWVVRI